MAGVYNGFIEPLVAAVGVVGLLAAVVGLDDDGAGAFSKMARCPDLMVKGSGQVLQECVERHFQCSFRIHSIRHLAPTLQELWLACAYLLTF